MNFLPAHKLQKQVVPFAPHRKKPNTKQTHKDQERSGHSYDF